MPRPLNLTILVAALAAVSACSGQATIPIEVSSPTPPAETAAANLRVHADLFFGEHTYLVAKLAVAAAGGRHDEFRSYAGVLAGNGGDLETLLRTSAGETAGAQFGVAWSQLNNFLVDYMVAAVTKDQNAAGVAAAGLTATAVPQLASAFETGVAMPADQATQLATAEALGSKLVIDDAAGAAYSKLCADVYLAHARAVAMADAVSAQIASQYHDRFPGDPTAKAAEFRAGISSLLQSEAYLLTMSSDAAVAGTADNVQAVETVLTVNAQAMATTFGAAFGEVAATQLTTVWSQEANLVVAYARGGDAAVRQNMLDRAAPPLGLGTVYGPDLTEAVTALLVVIDEQRARSYASVATDDAIAASQMAAAGDAMTATAKL